MSSTRIHFLRHFRFRSLSPSFSQCSGFFYRLGLSPVVPQVRAASSASNAREENDAEGGYASRRRIDQKTTEEDGVRKGASLDPKMDEFDERSVKCWLKQLNWMRYHPVEKLHLLQHIAENAPTLLLFDEAKLDIQNESMKRGKAKVTGMEGSTPPSSLPSHEGVLFAASDEEWLSYAARLQICLSLTMWVRGLRDAQDDIARLRLPYSPSTRMMASTSSSFHRLLSPTTTKWADPALVMRPFPTRKLEYLLDPFTSVELRLHGKLNPTGEQIPPPHTWDPELSLPLEDDDASMSEAGRLESILSKHGRRGPRESAKERLQRVQGLSPRPSALDNGEEGEVGLNWWQHSGSDSSSSSSILALLAAGRRNRQARNALACGRRRGSASSRLPHAKPTMPVVRFQEAEDTLYHGNTTREDGCPLDRSGCATPVSIYIPIEAPFRTPKGETKATPQSIVVSCIKAHAAILSSLFVEGRTVHFRSSHPAVVRYVQEVFHEFVDVRALCVSYASPTLLKEDGTVFAAPHPYYPAWSTRELLVLLPPKNTSAASAMFSSADVKSLVGSILQSIFLTSSPVTVAAPRREEVVEWPSYVLAVKNSVEEQLRFFFPNEATHGKQARVQWMRLPSPYEEHTGLPPARNGNDHHSGVSTFLEHLSLLSEHFYAVQLLYSPSNCFFSSREVKALAWHGFSLDTRLVGINVSLWHVLCLFPQVPFLSHKVGNCFRYRAVDRAVVARHRADPLLTSGVGAPLRFVQKWRKKLFRKQVVPIPSFHAGLPLLPVYEKAQSEAEAEDVLDASLKNVGASERQTSSASRITEKSTLSRGRERRKKKANLPDYCATYFLVCERIIDHLTQPSALSLFALCTARWFGV